MVSSVDVLLALGLLAGGVLYWFGYRASRLSNRLGRRSFVAFTALLGTGCVVPALAGFAPSVLPLGGDGGSWTQLPLLFWLLSTFPWFVFAVRYTGTRTSIPVHVLALAGLPHLLIFVELAVSIAGVGSEAFSAIGSVVFVYIISLAVAGTYLLFQNSYSYEHVALGQASSLSVAAIGTLMIWNLIGQQTGSGAGKAGAYAAGALGAAAGVALAWHRYDLFDSTPSIGTLGERALTRETDDLMFVVDSDDRIVELNETAVRALSRTRTSAIGSSVAALLGQDSEQLRDVETVTVQTTEGRRQYDPQVSTVSDHYDNDIGATISLRDVTERELREQRLAVLNRVLRHNLRNEVDVVKSHAEALAGRGEAVSSIIDAADTIAALGQRAHRIDQYVSESTGDVTVDLDALTRSVLDSIDVDETAVSVSVDCPADATVTTDRRAVIGALESALDNAVSYAESTVTVTLDPQPDGCVVRVVDDGPGIPDWELASLDAGTESSLQHSTGLGLWQLKWAVTILNGDLSFDTTDGTTVQLFVPDRGVERADT
ncbi:sensor histidine kinase [Halorubellus salinus]|uniref:sensor histidine kinase n=1 Tax=Halorubellus salinus TaxID=755309 RepID=UPI001D092C52|nr:HAMP domain-containing sensor histidine kinase [Halorubellus salinus]